MNQNYYDPNLCYNSNSSDFDQYQPPQYSVTHKPLHIKSMADLLLEDKISQALQALCEKLNKNVQEKQEENNVAKEQAAKVSSQYWKPPIYYDDDDDDEESSIPMKDIISKLPLSIAITPDFLITNSLIMKDEHLDTISETKSDEENESSVKDLKLTPSESEVLSKGLSEDLSNIERCSGRKFHSNPLLDEEIISTKIDLPHFNAEFDLIESLLNRDTSIVSSPKFDYLLEELSGELAHIDLISLEIDEANFDPEEEIHLVEKLLYDNSSPRPSKELNSKNSDVVIESFSPSPIPVEDSDSLIEEIDIFLAPDDSIPTSIENDDYDSEGDILFLKELLSNDSLSLPENESFHFNRYSDPSSPCSPAKTPDDDGIHFYIKPDTGTLTTKVVVDIFEHYVLVPSILPSHPTRCPVIDTLLLFSSENEDKVFNTGILASKEEKSPHLLSHRGFKAYQINSDFSESPMIIYGRDSPIFDVPFLHFYPPLPTQVWGIEIAPDYEDSRARGFVLCSLEFQSLA
ncbi:hypothetical protein Tco_1351028 [Tanacetum coccineum]